MDSEQEKDVRNNQYIFFSIYTVATHLTAGFFETGAMPTPTKSQNPTNCGWGGSFQSYLTHS